jgi:hypothetical protein
MGRMQIIRWLILLVAGGVCGCFSSAPALYDRATRSPSEFDSAAVMKEFGCRRVMGSSHGGAGGCRP